MIGEVKECVKKIKWIEIGRVGKLLKTLTSITCSSIKVARPAESVCTLTRKKGKGKTERNLSLKYENPSSAMHVSKNQYRWEFLNEHPAMSMCPYNGMIIELVKSLFQKPQWNSSKTGYYISL